MKLSIIKGNKIQNYVLPKEITTDYWITDYDVIADKKNLIQFQLNDGKWKIVSTSELKVVVNNTQVKEVELREYSFIYLKPSYSNNLIMIYCYPDYDNSFMRFKINAATPLSIGNDQKNDIFYNSNYITTDYALLSFNNGVWSIKSNNKPIYVNNYITKERVLVNGDIVFIMGLKIIYIGEYFIINNPNNSVRINNEKLIPSTIIRKAVEIPREDPEITLYSNDEYFHRSPRFVSNIKKKTFDIDTPPSQNNNQERPFLLTIGPMVTMSLTSVMFMWQSVNGILYGGQSLVSAMPTIVMAVAMLSSILLWPTISNAYDRRQRRKKEKKLIKKYTEYIVNNEREIDSEINNQKITLLQNHCSLDDCIKIIMEKNGKLWERRITDSDFLLLRIGIGTIDSSIEINTSKKGFSVDEDKLRDMLDKLVTKSNKIENVPICLPFTEKFVSAFVGDSNLIYQFLNGLILRMMTFHSYDDLKLCFFTNKDNEKYYDYLKMSPHFFDNENKIRLFASDSDEIQQVSNYLDEIFNKRKNSDENNSEKELNYKSFDPYYVIILDDIKEAKNSRIVKKILSESKNYGFSVIFRTANLTSLPNECNCFINIFEKESGLFENELDASKQKIFNADFLKSANMNKLISTLANIPIKNNETKGSIPESVGFLEMYNVGKVEQLNVQEKWKNNNSFLSLQAPIGIDDSGELFKLDVHEKYHGPHGLIAGMTGSGKSEFIITYILSLAVQYHPNDVSFVLIDYKGGGLSGAFENKETGVKLPHLAGSITNLDVSDLNRALASIQSELKRRQALFNKTRDKLNESTMDIYKYQRLYKQGVIQEPISHLLIISDEFAELKSQRPEFMEQLISTARIGRSLGVHLILATQKPAGVVNDQIWSNSRFRICLKVQERSDSMDVIKRPDAAELKNVGRFYVQVGYNELFTLGQAAWCGKQYIPNDTFKIKSDTSINFIDNVGNVVKSVDNKTKFNNVLLGEELPNIVKYLNNVAHESNITVRKLWLDKLPGVILVDHLRQKYGYNSNYLNINPIIGEYDDPSNQKQDLLTLPLSNSGNAIIYGVAGSGKEMLLNTLIYSTITSHSVEEVNIYVMDFGAETLKSFSKAPHVGDVMLVNDTEKINNLFKQLHETMENRKKLFADYNGDYKLYCKKSGKVLPTILVVINGFEIFQENFENYIDDMIKLTRECNRYGIVFIITSNSVTGLRFTLVQNFAQVLALKFNDNADYYSVLGGSTEVFPSKEKGRGLIKLDNVYEFQTASLTDSADISEYIEDVCKKLSSNPNSVFAAKIPVLPQKVTINDFANNITNLENLPIGISKETLTSSLYNFNKLISVITSSDNENLEKFSAGLISELLELKDIQLINIDASNILSSKMFNGGTFINNNFDNIFNSIFKFLEKQKQNNNIKYKKVVLVIEGINNFINNLSIENKNKLTQLLDLGNETKNINIILIDNISELKNITYEGWFIKHGNKKSFIWVGPGITSQYTFETTKMIRENPNEMDDTFGYVVQNGIPVLSKLIEYTNDDI